MLYRSILNCFFIFWVHWVFVAACRLSLVVASRLLIAVASLVAEDRLWGLRPFVVAACRLSSCGARA